MRYRSLAFCTIIFSAVFFVSACAPHQLYRADFSLCTSGDPEADCEHSTLQQRHDENTPDSDYLLGFIEFDDQGQLWNRDQMNAVINKAYEAASADDILLVVFVHGWKHSAAPHDDNITTFRGALQRISALESRVSKSVQRQPRKVVGVYLGWRGGSVTMPGVKELTFWERKNTAHKVGHGGVTEVLTRLELVKKTRDSIAQRDEPDPEEREKLKSRTRLVVIGHSFGGAVVFSAVSQILEGRFVDTHGPLGTITDVRSFGDLVVLINPAFEAARFATLSDMATERGTYFRDQLPVMTILTSEADYATKLAFPAGRWLSTLFEKERDVTRRNGMTGKLETVDQSKSNIKTVGHFDPYKTHFLEAAAEVDRETLHAPTVDAEFETLKQLVDGWDNDAPGKVIQFDGSTLTRGDNSAGRNPYLVVRVDKELIRDHNDIDDPRVISFIRQLILLASQGEEVRAMLRQ